MGRIARGGIRWSNRLLDLRSEIIDLVKAQRVKNAITVPEGAKGGFVLRGKPGETIDGQMAYQAFIAGLLDITDNRIDNQLVRPAKVLAKDDEDSYLVVAADKGTARFSDIANDASEQYEFWLADAFASGGKTGYDHKKLGITARGAWVALLNHLAELNIDITQQSLSVVGIGDMSGDVFGNGLLMSNQLRLIAAFNHDHIFLDPTPDPQQSFEERKRLFELPHSQWTDYDADIISPGGGVFSRKQKFITLSQEAQAALSTTETQLRPHQLISLILKASVDFIWNGGIGTYVKAELEQNDDISDKNNEHVRVNGRDLGCKIFCEGGNLGCTQKGRIEAANFGVMLNTDFIDNSAGVDCSDHEVNIKIVLASAMEANLINQETRNRTLRTFEKEVCELVLDNVRSQTLGISISLEELGENPRLYTTIVALLQEEQGLNLEDESLPSRQQLEKRIENAGKLTRPEIAVLTSYCKLLLKSQLGKFRLQDFVDAEYWLGRSFPKKISRTFSLQMKNSLLAQKTAINYIANILVDTLGIVGIVRLLSLSPIAVTLDAINAALLFMRYANDVKQWCSNFNGPNTLITNERFDFLKEKRTASIYAILTFSRYRHFSDFKDNNQCRVECFQHFNVTLEQLKHKTDMSFFEHYRTASNVALCKNITGANQSMVLSLFEKFYSSIGTNHIDNITKDDDSLSVGAWVTGIDVDTSVRSTTSWLTGLSSSQQACWFDKYHGMLKEISKLCRMSPSSQSFDLLALQHLKNMSL